MKKRLFSVLVVCALLLALIPVTSADTGISFLAVNDSLPYALDASTMPFYSGGILYIPYDIFNVAVLGVYTSYNPANMTLVLFNRDYKLLFYITDGTVQDENDRVYDLPVIVRSGMVFVPANYCVSYFGASLNYLVSLGGHNVYRITTGSQVLSNSTFINQADTLLEERAGDYLALTEPAPAPAQTTTPVQTPPPAVTVPEPAPPAQETPREPDPEPEEAPEEDPEPEEILEEEPGEEAPEEPEETSEPEEELIPEVYPVFLGMSQDLVNWLSGQDLRSAFFLTRAQIEADPALVRELHCQGHTIGLQAEDPQTLAQANDALYQAAGFKTLLALAPSAQDLDPAGYLLCRIDQAGRDFLTQPAALDRPVLVAFLAEEAGWEDCLTELAETCLWNQLAETSSGLFSAVQ